MGMQDYNAAVIEEFRANHGKVAAFGDAPVVLVSMTGAKSGAQRVKPLVALLDDGRIYVIASKGGSPRNPDWYYNLVAHPDVEVELGDERFGAVAVPVTGPERDRLYALQASRQPAFAEYAQKAGRVIPVVELRRA